VSPEGFETGALLDDMSDSHPGAERRLGRRVRLRWPLSILKGSQGGHVLSTVTENLSSRGFCCVVDEALAAGESVACILTFPVRPENPVSQALRCQARVVWVRALENGHFGIGCRIDDYTVVS
jgi:hypothetical protein